VLEFNHKGLFQSNPIKLYNPESLNNLDFKVVGEYLYHVLQYCIRLIDYSTSWLLSILSHLW